MSVVTNIVVFADCGEWKQTLTDLGFSEVSENAGGTKWMEATVYAAAFNHLNDLEKMVGDILNAGWESPEKVQVFVKKQDDEVFTQHNKEQP